MSPPNQNKPTPDTPAASPRLGGRLDVTAGETAQLDTLALDLNELDTEEDTVVLRSPLRARPSDAMSPAQRVPPPASAVAGLASAAAARGTPPRTGQGPAEGRPAAPAQPPAPSTRRLPPMPFIGRFQRKS